MRERANGVAAVVGGSLSGLFAGIALLKGNWDITVYERANEVLDDRGAGIVAQQP
jgi:2-polyprenyl-6-methoxyphenol hydroxylase-like FAD-dependent oxidoreductase